MNNELIKMYANSTKAQITKWDLTLIFGEQKCIENLPYTKVDDQISVTMSPYHFKAFADTVNKALEAFEAQNGIINVNLSLPVTSINKKKTIPNNELAEKLLNWLHDSWQEEYISLPDIYQRGLNKIETKERALHTIGILQNYGWVEEIDGPMYIKGKKRKRCWKILPVE